MLADLLEGFMLIYEWAKTTGLVILRRLEIFGISSLLFVMGLLAYGILKSIAGLFDTGRSAGKFVGKAMFHPVFSAIQAAINIIFGIVQDALNTLKTVVNQIVRFLRMMKQKFDEIFNLTKRKMNQAFQELKSSADVVKNGVLAGARGAEEGLKMAGGTVKASIKNLKQEGNNAIRGIDQGLAKFGSRMDQLGESAISGMKNAATKEIGRIAKTFDGGNFKLNTLKTNAIGNINVVSSAEMVRMNKKVDEFVAKLNAKADKEIKRVADAARNAYNRQKEKLKNFAKNLNPAKL